MTIFLRKQKRGRKRRLTWKFSPCWGKGPWWCERGRCWEWKKKQLINPLTLTKKEGRIKRYAWCGGFSREGGVGDEENERE